MSDSTFAFSYKTPVDLRWTCLRPTARVIGEGFVWLGGGALFAVTVFVMVALPGFIE